MNDELDPLGRALVRTLRLIAAIWSIGTGLQHWAMNAAETIIGWYWPKGGEG